MKTGTYKWKWPEYIGVGLTILFLIEVALIVLRDIRPLCWCK